MKPTIGLFGTCGCSKWRDAFVAEYEAKGIQFFNPNKADWSPADAINEAKHLDEDEIIIIVVTDETFGTASLAETGYCLANIELDKGNVRKALFYIQPKVSPELMAQNPQAAKESNNTRAIVSEHLKILSGRGHDELFYLATSLQDLLQRSKFEYEYIEQLG